MRPTPEELSDAWPRIVRGLAAATGSLDDAEEYAAESLARAAAHHGRIDSLAAWCITVGKRAWLDDRRRRSVLARLSPQLTPPIVDETAMTHDPDDPLAASTDLDDRVALLYVACDEQLSETSQLVLARRIVCGLTIPEITTHASRTRCSRSRRAQRHTHAVTRGRPWPTSPGAGDGRSRPPSGTARSRTS
ncbi:MAG: hypothetical protein L0H79_03480 [Intrasporangium sp.]|uniref:hypothetical protein n=1 Tax=Intrasporangium sp. TaxID=1925024 RepID=UPI00264810AD|nr:hypothetical protein [Intrasporangium sp.]MDN5794797.1 hypothetical protein [Intrasporangium sp.]